LPRQSGKLTARRRTFKRGRRWTMRKKQLTKGGEKKSEGKLPRKKINFDSRHQGGEGTPWGAAHKLYFGRVISTKKTY